MSTDVRWVMVEDRGLVGRRMNITGVSSDMGKAILKKLTSAGAYWTVDDRIDILVNCIGGMSRHKYQHFLDQPIADHLDVFHSNYELPMMSSVDAFRRMRAQGYGRIINISSTAVKYVGANSLAYAAAKSALETFTMGLAREGAKDNVLCNVVRLGPIETSGRQKIEGYDSGKWNDRVGMVPVGRAGTVEDVARSVLHLVSSDFITGSIMTVAGGE